MIRRGRVKFAYEGKLSQFVLQIDATEKGVALKDAYINFKDPWLQMFTLQAGVFDRPFGFEVHYSSSMRESPERARITQTLFPQERDLGAMLTIQPRKESRFQLYSPERRPGQWKCYSIETDSVKKILSGNSGSIKLPIIKNSAMLWEFPTTTAAYSRKPRRSITWLPWPMV